ncbi:MAG: UUP1 family membrane protein [Gammaproteobacteria bacterium]|nr:UUP1 family membrane protein [Gammaproteobacteria bacterium]MDH5799488.1 UUP1 family membrane protein [Gammaproteobacteria bacterium]
MNKNLGYSILLLVSLLLPASLMIYKLYILDYTVSGLIPAVSYNVDITLQVDGHGDDIQLGTFLPRSDARQKIMDEQSSPGLFSLGLQSDALNRMAQWTADSVSGNQTVRYNYSVLGRHVRYVLPENAPIPNSYPQLLQKYLLSEPGVPVNDPLIELELAKILGSEPNIKPALTAIHRHLQDKFANRNFSGFTDALTALKLGEASCNGKGRLFVAMARKLNLPARLVGGLILNPGSKRTSHQWVEVYVNGHWVPFDTINDHFAEIPANFVSLYYGDQVLFKHTTNVNFQYNFKILKRLVPQAEVQQSLSKSSFNILNIYSVFERVGISQNLLKILLMIPLGAFVVVIFRNVIGVETFGTFLPALIAAASRETGLLWGAIGFTLIILISSLVRRVLDSMQLLHSPKMAIMLTTVVIVMLIMTVLGVQFGLFELAHITLFPIAILAITAERFAIIETEQGWRKAFKITASTLMVIAAAYVVMDSLFLQSMILAFPELLLVIVALNLWLGKWVGMRLSEFYRFRGLIFNKASA